ncbi:MAG: YggS family pyridoxal phosphate-dependent enzyme [Alphaproteobacteria bacterium]|nr:YggS family pyridoxal phosphate-dependent enzyme [Alphaproteobacteria bacterium]
MNDTTNATHNDNIGHNIRHRLDMLNQKISEARKEQPNLARDEVTLIAVSKTFDAPAIIPFIEAGVKNFGENRVQEAMQKWTPLKQTYPDCILHLIGPLQRNKVKQAVALFDVIHSVDRPQLLQPLKNAMRDQNRDLPVLIQVNISDEPQKSGIAVQDLADFITLATQTYQMNVIGLMCIPNLQHDPSPYFAHLYQLAKQHDLPHLSMGMSNDFETAIRFGASYIRVGSLLFGQRDNKEENN